RLGRGRRAGDRLDAQLGGQGRGPVHRGERQDLRGVRVQHRDRLAPGADRPELPILGRRQRAPGGRGFLLTFAPTVGRSALLSYELFTISSGCCFRVTAGDYLPRERGLNRL